MAGSSPRTVHHREGRVVGEGQFKSSGVVMLAIPPVSLRQQIWWFLRQFETADCGALASRPLSISLIEQPHKQKRLG